jgi:hypothetical protein
LRRRGERTTATGAACCSLFVESNIVLPHFRKYRCSLPLPAISVPPFSPAAVPCRRNSDAEGYVVDAATNLHFNRIATVLMSAAHNGQPYATQVRPHKTSQTQISTGKVHISALHTTTKLKAYRGPIPPSCRTTKRALSGSTTLRASG